MNDNVTQAPVVSSDTTQAPETAPVNESTTSIVKTATATTETKNQGAFMNDIHVNISGLCLFACVAVGIIWPEYKAKADALSDAAIGYLFASAKAK